MKLNYDIPAEGSVDADIVLIGEAPANEEYRTGLPFQGSAGQHLDRLLKLAGLNRNDLRITNLSKERAPNNKMANMPFDRLRMWERDLVEELNLLPGPKILIPMGNYALQAVAGRNGIMNLRGSILHSVEEIVHDCVVLPTIHPSALHYNYTLWPLIVADFTKAKKIADQSETFKFPTYNFLIQPSFKQVMETFDMLLEMKDTLMSIDVETPHMLLSCIGIGWSRSDAFCLPFFWGNGSNYWPEEEELVIWRRLADILPKLNLANQNVLFDWEIMLNHRIRMSTPTYDPMLMHACLYSELPHKLDVITSIYTDMEFFKKDEKEEKGSALKAGREIEHWRYNCFDCVSALWCIEELKAELIEENMLDVYMALFAESIEPIFLMNTTGIRADTERLSHVRVELQEDINKRNSEISTAVGHELNVASPKQVANVLYHELNMVAPKSGGSKEGLSSEGTLKKLAYKYQIDLPLKIIEARKVRKLQSLFAEENISEDGRIRCQYSLMSKTGRMRSTKKKGGLGGRGMNLQNVKASGPARSFFIPEDGHILLGADQKQAEAMIVAWFSKDENMKDLFRSGTSIHIENARNLYNEVITKTDPRYRVAKALVHAGNYGIGPWGFARTANVSFAEAKEKLALYYNTYPGIKQNFHKYIQDELKQSRTIYNPFGRRQIFFGRLDDNLYRAGYAFYPQSTVADINKKAVQRIYKTYLPLLDTHDGLVISVRKDEIAKGFKVLRDAYDTEFQVWGETIKIPVSLAIGENWRDLNDITDEEVESYG